jgi:drug/metabolite transporter (DMT)-like permease
MSRQTGHTLLLTATSLIWGMAFVAQSMGAVLGPYTFLACRSWLGVAVLLPTIGAFDAVRRRKGLPSTAPAGRAQRRQLRQGGLVCGSFLFVASAAQQTAITWNPSTAKASFITAMYVVLVPVAGIFLGKRCGRQVWLCVAISVAGLYLLCMKNGFGSVEKSDWLLMACAALFTGQILAVDHFAPLVDGVRLSCLEFLTTATWSTVCMFLFEQPRLADIAASAVPILYCGILSSGVAYTLQILGQRDLNPAIACLAMCLESVFGALGGWWLLGQTLSARELTGCALIFAAVVLAQLPLGQLLRRCRGTA